MKRITLHKIFGTAALMIVSARTSANPIVGRFVDDGRGDALSGQMLSREIGDVAVFPAADAISYHDHRASVVVGVPDDGIANDWTVHMTNVSGQAWKNLYFVADLGATIGNSDGKAEDMLGAPGIMTDAFRIDAVGANAPLLEESMTADGIFQPGEDWEFAVYNFGTGANSFPPELISPGVFSGSSPMVAFAGTNSSIIASPVPEPSITAPLIFAGCALLARRTRRSH